MTLTNPLQTEDVAFSDIVHWTSKQKLAAELAMKFDYTLYGGAMGGGKSYWIRWMCLRFLLHWFGQFNLRNVVAGIFCENYPALKDRHLQKIPFEFPEWIGKYHDDHKQYGKAFILNPEYGSGVIVFRNLDDPSKYQSAEFAVIAVDELTKNDKSVFDFLRTRKRWPGLQHTKFIAGSNPGGIGHNWVKKLWIDKQFETGEEEQKQFMFVQSLAYDNPHIEKEYFKSLSSLPERMKQAFLMGDWTVFAGQYFPEWKNDRHVKEIHVDSSMFHFIGMDYGYEAPSAIGFYAVLPGGHVHMYDEIYIRHQTYQDIGTLIKDKIKHYGFKYQFIVSDPAVHGDKEHHRLGFAGETGAESIGKIVDISVIRGDNRRIIGWGRLRIYLQHDLFSCSPKCVELIRTLPTLIHDENKPEDVDTDGDDHAGDQLRYSLMTRPEPNIIKKTQETGTGVRGIVIDYRMDQYIKKAVEDAEKKDIEDFATARRDAEMGDNW